MVVFVLSMTAMFSGCGQKDNASSSDVKTSGDATDNNKAEEANFNETGLPIVQEPVTLKVAARKRESIKKPFEELEMFKQIQEATNVHVEWQTTPVSSWNEKKNLILSGGKWPDVFYGNYVLNDNEIVKLAADGVFIPLEDLIDKYAPNIQKVFEEYPEFKAYITAADGHIYSLPTIHANFPYAIGAQFINKRWLDELGLEIPETTDEFYEVLKAFKGRGNSDEVPLSFRYMKGASAIQGIAGMFGAFGLTDNDMHIVVKDDKVIYTAIQPEYKEAVKYMHTLFAEGLVDVESFSQTYPVYKSKMKNSKVGVVNLWGLNGVFGGNYKESDYVFMPPLKGPGGDQGYVWKPSGALSGKGSFLITSTCQHPEVAIRWADYMVDPEISFQLSEGPIGKTFERTEDGKLKPIPDPEGMSHDEFRHQETAGANSFHMVTAEFLKNVIPSSGVAEKRSYEPIYEKVKDSIMFPPYYESPEDAKRAAIIRADVDEYIRETTSRWMLSGGIEEEWDAYVKQLKAMGVDELQEIYQRTYDTGQSMK